MSTTNHTTNYELSQYIGTDVTSYLSNYNSDMYKIDAQMKVNAVDAAEAKSDASAAVSTSTAAASNASAAVSTANAANTTAEAAQTAATAAQTAAGAAQTDAAAALRASASNTIGNLAPAYDPTLTYEVDDLITYVDPETNQGKLYKCIIAIAVPEEFNINKWDDVTTSEVYAPSEKHYDFITDGTETILNLWKRILSWCATNLNSEEIKNMHILSDYIAATQTGAAYRLSGYTKTDNNNLFLGVSNIGGTIATNGGSLDTIFIGFRVDNGIENIYQIQTIVGINVADSASTPTVNTVAVYKESTALMSARTIRVVW